jgi:soluble lytic murein transglycosylase-like protein
MEWLITILLPLVSNVPDHNDLMLKLVKTESNFKMNAVRHERHLRDKSIGVGQVLTKTAKSLGYDEKKMQPLDEPFVNLYYSSMYLKMCLDRSYNTRDALCRYNSGLMNDKKCHKVKYNQYVAKIYGEKVWKRVKRQKYYQPINII